MTFQASDMVLAKDAQGNISAAGFPLDSTLAQTGQPAIAVQSGGGKREPLGLSGLAVPAGLYTRALETVSAVPTLASVEDGGTAPDGLIDRLLALAAPAAGTKKSQAKAKAKQKRKSKRRRKAAASRNTRRR